MEDVLGERMTTFFQTNAKICMIKLGYLLQWLCHMIIYRPSLVQISLIYFMDRWTNPPSKISSKLMTTLTCLKSSMVTLILFASLESLNSNQGRMCASNSAGCWWPSSSKLILPSRLMSKWSSIAWRSLKPVDVEVAVVQQAVAQAGVDLTKGLGAGWRVDEKQRGDEEEKDPHGQETLKSELESSKTDFGVAKNSTGALFGLINLLT